ncbi:nuclear transport factor 2 family protein [Paucibacter sp. R3-3]|uniref:Nuclear transport factor 2 family protein n=1 Tax=Roseateles agri TaxID=3098619 RepID=A0ABU5DKJ4_9BURK|nr:nuclear transport factor 2 family protein [Paucibacter sp. R3-3]MDY0746281.1 nuclear transport factor 2 family protein [Paucibacter sp. R3-3]
MTKLLVTLAAALTFSGAASAQTDHSGDPDAELTAIIAKLDQKHFDAFNNCDTDTLLELYAPDVEFFHDLSGRVLNREQFIQAVKKNICGKVQRRLLPGTMEVYPMAKIGAIQMGRHCFAEPGKADCIQQGRYYILWRFDGTRWQIARVFSYDHRPMAGAQVPQQSK